MLLTKKKYNNKIGNLTIPFVWREEFKMDCGVALGIDLIGNIVIIDKREDREYTRVVTDKGKITIPIELRQELGSKLYNVFVIQTDEKILLTPITL
ncbi:hypothetical protein P4V41_21530 [Fictibacillus nanhaiensis]|uniref:hypothetical protein n=1 Tax=Fictibacillus nanhaiensis TaxID=742169 RepID=UPI002E22AA44|nr:hypothetical protein [Fictibacillus nanhaiensis]